MKLNDISILARNIQNEMPVHTKNTASIPYSFTRFPKNLMEESHKVDNKFLNNHQAEIEEAYHCKILKPEFIKWYLIQQSKHLNAGILNHDGFFSRLSKISKNPTFYSSFTLFDLAFLASLQTQVNGADIETLGTWGGSMTSGWNDKLHASKTNNGIVGKFYDQIAPRVGTNSGGNNLILAVYDDLSTAPNALLSSKGSYTPTASTYTFQTVTEFSLSTALNWIAIQASSTSIQLNFQGITSSRKDMTNTFPTIPNTFTVAATSDNLFQAKIGHS